MIWFQLFGFSDLGIISLFIEDDQNIALAVKEYLEPKSFQKKRKVVS